MPNPNSFPTPGAVLWAVDVDLERDVFRSGAATKPNVEYLRFVDLNIDDQEGRIPDDQADRFNVNPGQGISLFLERMIPDGLVLMDAATWKNVDIDRGRALMKNLDFTDRELTYILISLRKYEEKMLSDEAEDMEDTATDLLFVQSLISKLKAARSSQ